MSSRTGDGVSAPGFTDARMPRTLSRRAILAAATPLILAACSSAPLETFELAAVPLEKAVQPRQAVISIGEPTAPSILATNRIAIRRSGGDYVYLAGAQWSDVLTQMVQRRLMESFETAHLFRAIATTGTASDYILASDIRRFEIDSDSSKAVVEIAVRLVAARTGKTLKGTIVTGSAPSPTTGAAGITAALDAAFGQAADRMLSFAVSQT